jgi:hypothetical protein
MTGEYWEIRRDKSFKHRDLFYLINAEHSLKAFGFPRS